MNSKRIFLFAKSAAVLAICILLSSCGGNKKADGDDADKSAESMAAAPFKADISRLDTGRALYKTMCSPCHGKEGKGDGPAAPNLNPKPRDHSNGAYMNKLTDDHIGTVIRNGGATFGYPNMPSQPQFKDDEINALIAHVRTLAK